MRRALVAALILTDSLLLLARVMAARVRDLGLPGAVRFVRPSARRVLYIDCGVHKRGAQLRYMSSWFADRCDLQLLGFEASEEHHREAVRNLADIDHLDLRQLALVGPDADTDHVKLYKEPGEGKGDSLYVPSSHYEVVPAERLSAVLQRDYASWLDDASVLLRMNIEGSEYDVIEDLVRSGLAARVDGYFGMWDDVSKIDPAKDRRFRQMLKTAGITTVTFNDRDLGSRMRRLAIRLAIDRSIRRDPPPRPHRTGASGA